MCCLTNNNKQNKTDTARKTHEKTRQIKKHTRQHNTKQENTRQKQQGTTIKHNTNQDKSNKTSKTKKTTKTTHRNTCKQ